MIDLDKLRSFRVKKGYSQENMAGHLSVSQPAYAQIESGKTKLNTQILEKICGFLEVNVEDLMEGNKSINISYNKFTDNSTALRYNERNQKIENQLDEHIKILRDEIVYLHSQNEKFLKLLEKK